LTYYVACPWYLNCLQQGNDRKHSFRIRWRVIGKSNDVSEEPATYTMTSLATLFLRRAAIILTRSSTASTSSHFFILARNRLLISSVEVLPSCILCSLPNRVFRVSPYLTENK
jgi:hypothetical protein